MVRFAFALACTVGLAGCEGFNSGTSAPPVKQAALLGGAVGVAGPDGYCIDVSDSRLARGFAIIAPCANLGLVGARVMVPSAIVTVQAGRIGTAAVSGSEPAFAGLLETDAGAALLSRSGDASSVDVLDTTSSDNKVTVYFEDKEGAAIPGTQDQEWRAFVDINGRLVTISARGLATAPMSAQTGKLFLDQVVAAVVGANAA